MIIKHYQNTISTMLQSAYYLQNKERYAKMQKTHNAEYANRRQKHYESSKVQMYSLIF